MIESTNSRFAVEDLGSGLFQDAEGRAYARTETTLRKEVFEIPSPEFRDFVSHRFYLKEKRAIRRQQLDDIMETARAKAKFEGGTEKVWIRSGWAESDSGERLIEIDLGNKERQCVRVTKDGWSIEQPALNFLRRADYAALPIPSRNGDFNRLFDFLNLADEPSRNVVRAFAIAAAWPDGPYPMLVFSGEQGSAKTSSMEWLTSIIDPGSAKNFSLPRSEQDLFVFAKPRRLLTFDNLSGIRGDTSDALCRILTGGTFSKRKLYTDEDTATISVMRPIISNSIVEIASRQDLADRTFILSLPRIEASKRRPKDQLDQEFLEAQPSIFAGLMSALSSALQNIEATQLSEAPRLANVARQAAAAAPVFGQTGSQIVRDLISTQTSQSQNILLSDPVCYAIILLMSNQTTWAGTPTQLFGELGRFSADHGLASMPRSAHALTMALNRNRPALRSIGLDIESGRTAHQRLTKINRRIEFEEFAKEIALPLDRKWIMGPGQGTSLDEMEMQAPGNENQGQSNTSSVHSVSVKNT